MLTVAMLLALGCASHGRRAPAPVDPTEPAPVNPPGQDLAALVDSDRARLLLSDLLTRRATDRRLAARASTVVVMDRPGPAPEAGWLPNQAWLREQALEVSLDFAALAFARAIGADERSRAVQAAFDRFLEDGPARAEDVLRRRGTFPYTVLFAPSWFYRTFPDTGADFARQRRLLDRLGIPHRLIPTVESGSVEDNAAVIAAAVREAGRPGARLILVSASKSGAEVALALSRVLRPDETASVAGWLNVAGALRGSPLADSALRPPASWIARFVFWVAGWNWAGMTSMATAPSRQRLEGARLPDSIAVVNLVAVPVSGSVGHKVVLGYEILREHGPNDGVVLLADTVWPGGANIVALGSDHLLAARQNDAHDLALLWAMDFAVRLHGTRTAGGGDAD